MANICLIEDEKDLNDILSLYLEKDGHHVSSGGTLREALELLKSKDTFDLWVLDIMLPDGSGVEILKQLKEFNPSIPVILISARNDSFDRVLGFELGCDDYVSKPFLPAELVYRVSKVLERQTSQVEEGMIDIAPYHINVDKRFIFLGKEKINVTSREFDIIYYFISNPSIAISRDTLLRTIWGENFYGYDRVVDNYIKNIRKKMPEFNIETIYGYGYRFNK
ncbi:MAG: response regulator transcription factor [Tissierellia bacterium]|nr:response regulator transcription factor [Tissierellia bacterium]